MPKGRLWSHSLRYMRELGIEANWEERGYHYGDPGKNFQVTALKLQDIPQVLGDGLADFAIVSDEWLIETQVPCKPIIPLCWYHTKICLLRPETNSRSGSLPAGKLSVATSLPGIAQWMLRGETYVLRTVTGAVEAYAGTITDLALDCVESGETARANALVVAEELFRCDVRLVRRAGDHSEGDAVQCVIRAAASTSLNPTCQFASETLSLLP